MAESINIAAFFLFLLSVFPGSYAVPYTVGNGNGWTINVDYTAWASRLNFTVGDTLVFNYGPRHSVAEVSEANYKSCNASSPMSLYTTGPTTITLNTTVDRYFICAAPYHCDLGQKLPVFNVKSAPAFVDQSTPGNTTAPPPTVPSSGAGTLAAGSQIISSLVLGAILFL